MTTTSTKVSRDGSIKKYSSRENKTRFTLHLIFSNRVSFVHGCSLSVITLVCVLFSTTIPTYMYICIYMHTHHNS